MKQPRQWSVATLERREMLAGDAGTEVIQASNADVAAMPVGAPAPTAAEFTREGSQIVFLDASVDDPELLARGIASDCELVLLSDDQPGLSQIGRAIAGRTNVRSIHIIAHGSAGQLQLGGELVDINRLRQPGQGIADWADALSASADILLYGCDVGSGAVGEAFVRQLAHLTGADVAASTDRTGGEPSADWELERVCGTIESSLAVTPAVRARYHHALPITVRAAGLTGEEQMRLVVSGSVVQSWNVAADSLSDYTVNLNGVSASDVRVEFVNDRYDPASGLDRNLRVDRIVIDGQTFETEASNVFSTGTWKPEDGIVPGFREDEVLHSNGYFQYAGNSGNGSRIEILAAGVENTETLQLELDGERVQTFTSVGGDAYAGQFVTLSYQADRLVDPGSVRLVMPTDRFDPVAGIDENLRIDAILIDGIRYETEAPTVFSTGTWKSDDGIAPGFRESEFLHAAGYLQFGDGGPTTVITVNARGTTGEEAFDLQIDGQTVRTFENVATFTSPYRQVVSGDVTPDQVRVRFLNDRFDSTSGADRNLVVDNVVIGQTRIETESSQVYSTGTWLAADGIVPGFRQSEVLHTNGYFQYGGVTIPDTATRVQAETGRFFGPNARSASDHQNFDGTGFAAFLTSVGDGFEIFVDVEQAGRYDLDIRYGAGPNGPAADRTIQLEVADQRVPQLAVARTGGWSLWHNAVQTVDLQAGRNVVRFVVGPEDTGFINVDYVDVRRFQGRLPTASQDNLLDDDVRFSSTDLQVQRLATLPGNPARGSQTTPRINSITTRPGDPGAVYTSSQDGRVYRVSTSGDVTLFLDVDGDIEVTRQNAFHGGLRSIAFHPDFDTRGSAGYGKLYASLLTVQPNASANYIGTSTGNIDSVVAEWTYDDSRQRFTGFRELFRVRNPQFDHPIKELSFNTAARPGDADYGLLYIAHGDGSVFNSRTGTGQITNDALGKILRINPLASGGLLYTTPGNVFAQDGDPTTLAEVYSYGHRNPHHINFGRTDDGRTFLITAEIGQDNIEEINLVRIDDGNGDRGDNGRSFGWGDREGTFEKLSLSSPTRGIGYGIGVGVENLRLDDGGREFVYPVLQWDHDDPQDNLRLAIAGGPVINGRYFYGNFAGNSARPAGQTYSVDVGQLLAQKTTFDATAGESTSDLTYLVDQIQHRLSYNGQTFDTFAQLLNADGAGGSPHRTDVRFDATADGRLILTSKRNGAIYIVDNASDLPRELV